MSCIELPTTNNIHAIISLAQYQDAAWGMIALENIHVY